MILKQSGLHGLHFEHSPINSCTIAASLSLVSIDRSTAIVQNLNHLPTFVSSQKLDKRNFQLLILTQVTLAVDHRGVTPVVLHRTDMCIGEVSPPPPLVCFYPAVRS